MFPQYRGRGFNPLLVGYILRSLAIESQGRAFIESAEWNDPQLASLNIPFRRLGLARKLMVSRRTIVCWSEDENLAQLHKGDAKDPSIGVANGSEGNSRLADLKH